MGNGALERIRTSDPQLRKLVLYPLSYERARPNMVPLRPTIGTGRGRGAT